MVRTKSCQSQIKVKAGQVNVMSVSGLENVRSGLVRSDLVR